MRIDFELSQEKMLGADNRTITIPTSDYSEVNVQFKLMKSLQLQS